MTNTAKWSILTSVLILVALVIAVPRLLAGPEAHEDAAAPVATRPDCPVSDIGHVSLPCLGGDAAGSSPKPTVVNVWAWWCKPCREELPLFDALAAQHPEWNVIGVHADTNAANGAALLNELGLQLPSLQDDGNQFAGTFGLPGVVPITVVFDEQGKLVQSFPAVFGSQEELDRAVSGALR